MRIAYSSDLHLEFSLDFKLKNTNKADVLILAGDTLPVIRESNWKLFLNDLVDEFASIILVLGNHEYYHTSIDTGLSELLEITSNYSQVTVLNNSSLKIDDITFCGATLWTNLNPIDAISIRLGMMDFKVIDDFTTDEWNKQHQRTLDWINSLTFESTEKRIMITHHIPHSDCIDPYFKYSPINPGFCAYLPELIINKFDIWFSGHTHHEYDFFVNNTRLICNPRGYPSEKNPFELKYIEY